MEIKGRQQILILLTIIVVALYAGDQLVFTPLVKSWKARKQRIHELQAQVQQGKSLLEREQTIRQRWQELRHNALPSDKSSAEQQFFKVIDKWASESGATVASITPQWKRDSDEYTTYQCRVDVAGNLSTLSRFLFSIENEPMALRLESFELGARDKEGKQLSLGLQLSGLVLVAPAK